MIAQISDCSIAAINHSDQSEWMDVFVCVRACLLAHVHTCIALKKISSKTELTLKVHLHFTSNFDLRGM